MSSFKEEILLRMLEGDMDETAVASVDVEVESSVRTCLMALTENLGMYSLNDEICRLIVVINRLLPRIESCDENLINDYAKKELQSRVTTEIKNHKEFIELIYKPILEVLKFCFITQNNALPTHGAVLLKMLNTASLSTLLQIMSCNEFQSLIKKLLMSSDQSISHIALKSLVIISKAQRSTMKTQMLDFEVNFLIKVLGEEQEEDEESERAKEALKFYKENDLESMIIEQFEAYEPLLEARNRLKELDIVGAFQIISKILTHDNRCQRELIHSGVVDQLERLLGTDDHKRSHNLKTFLEVFLRLKGETGNELDKEPIRILLMHLIATFEYLHEEILIQSQNREMAENSYVIFCRRSKASVTSLLRYLYALNTAWGHWLEVFDAPQLFSFDEFVSSTLERFCETSLESINAFGINDDLFETVLDTARNCPFLLSYDTRKMALDTILRLNREICFCPQANDTVTIMIRGDVIESFAYAFIHSKWCKGKKMNFQFLDENGIGEGVTKELFSLVSREYQEFALNFWFGESVTNSDSSSSHKSYVYCPNGLFPLSSKDDSWVSDNFSILGKIMGRAIVERQVMDIPINVEFYRRIQNPVYLTFRKSYYDVAKVLPDTSKLISQLITVKREKDKIESDSTLTRKEKLERVENLMFDEGCSFDNLMIDFTVPGYPGIELKEEGKNIMLTASNIDEYLENLGTVVMENDSLKAFREGFDDMFTLTDMDMFTPEELKTMFGGQEAEDWNVEYLSSCCAFHNGYAPDSEPVRFLFQVMSSLDSNEKREFLKFVTGRPNLPLGGLKILHTPLTIMRIPYAVDKENLYLPTALTCFNMIYLPEYTSIESTREKLLLAMNEGNRSFQIS